MTASQDFTTQRTTKISWTTHTWNPVSGCDQVSPGCKNCYAKNLAERYRGTPAFRDGFDLTLRPHKLVEPRRLKEPARIFVNSMSDLFHEGIPAQYLKDIWAVMATEDRHVYQVLTKRPERMAAWIMAEDITVPDHIWLGVSVENQLFANRRIPSLLATGAPVKFLSCEPLLGPINLRPWIAHLQWVIDGGESGPGRRPAEYDWFRKIRDVAVKAGVPYFHKQGNHFRSEGDKELDGEIWAEMPDVQSAPLQAILI